ncbi:MAG: hypothetical protein LLF94_11950 [Chlamydiales bacterium]|nr:hypothetical protein [Chlamydiales bacterium]
MNASSGVAKRTNSVEVESPQPLKRTKQDGRLQAIMAANASLFQKFDLPTSASQLGSALQVKGEKILNTLEAIEDIEPLSLSMLVWEPGQVLKSFKTNNIAFRALGILKFGQQDPDWFDRMSVLAEEVGKLSEYCEANRGSLARGSYVRVYNALDKLISSFTEHKIENLRRLLFYADALITTKSSTPSYQSTAAVVLFELHDFVRKLDDFARGTDFDNRDVIKSLYMSIGITSKNPRDYLFSEEDCDITKWTENHFFGVLDTLCSAVAEEGWDTLSQYEAMKNELQARIASLSVFK